MPFSIAADDERNGAFFLSCAAKNQNSEKTKYYFKTKNKPLTLHIE